MRFAAPFLLLLLIACSGRNGLRISSKPPALPKDREINISYDVYDVCSTYYVRADRPREPQLARVLWLDSLGREKEEVYLSFHSYEPATSVLLYDGNGRKQLRYYRIDEKTTRQTLMQTNYYYNEKGLLARTLDFDFERRLKPEVDKGYGRPGGCIVYDSDYEGTKSWSQRSECKYVYDALGKLVEKDPFGYSDMDRSTYAYDEKGRVIEEQRSDGRQVTAVEKRRYRPDGYETTFVWFENGAPKKEVDGSVSRIDTFRYKTDAAGLMLEEKVIEGGGRQSSRTAYFYNGSHRLVREEIYNDKDQMLGYYVYRYISNRKPVRRNFFVDNK